MQVPRSAFLLAIASLVVLTANALPATPAPTLIRDVKHPVDSRGETVYSLRTDETQDEPTVPGILILPKPRKLPKPKYPPSLKKAKKDADVEVNGVVTPDGHVIDAEIDGAIEEDVRTATLDAVSRYEITPARLNGTPIALRIKVMVAYRIW